MKSFLSLLALLLLAPGVRAEVPRAASLGMPCDSFERAEKDAGSTLAGKSSRPDRGQTTYFFKGLHQGQRATISYECSDARRTLDDIQISFVMASKKQGRVAVEREVQVAEGLGYKSCLDSDKISGLSSLKKDTFTERQVTLRKDDKSDFTVALRKYSNKGKEMEVVVSVGSITRPLYPQNAKPVPCR